MFPLPVPGHDWCRESGPPAEDHQEPEMPGQNVSSIGLTLRAECWLPVARGAN
jgi:hypothetical protein